MIARKKRERPTRNWRRNQRRRATIRRTTKTQVPKTRRMRRKMMRRKPKREGRSGHEVKRGETEKKKRKKRKRRQLCQNTSVLAAVSGTEKTEYVAEIAT